MLGGENGENSKFKLGDFSGLCFTDILGEKKFMPGRWRHPVPPAPLTLQFFFAIRFTLVRLFFIPKFSSIPCLIQQYHQRPKTPVVVGLKNILLKILHFDFSALPEFFGPYAYDFFLEYTNFRLQCAFSNKYFVFKRTLSANPLLLIGSTVFGVMA